MFISSIASSIVKAICLKRRKYYRFIPLKLVYRWKLPNEVYNKMSLSPHKSKSLGKTAF